MEDQNPWWFNEEDETYQEWKNSEIKWIPKVIEKIDLKPFSLHFLVGPRQIGKTTLLKILIHRLIQKQNPKSVFYFSCDEILDYKELGEVLDNYLSFRDTNHIKSSIIILDEITYVEEWFRAIKYRIDSGKFKNDVLIITGSTSIEVLKERERFPGRRGNGKDIFFYPMDFSEYIEHFSSLKLTKYRLSLNNIELALKANTAFKKSINELFRKYLVTGGFPLSIKDVFQKGKVSQKTFKTTLEWMKNDWKKAGKDERYMKEIISYLLKARLSPISWNCIAKETSVNSPHTVESYINVLKDTFCAKVLNQIAPDSKILYRKNKKIHFIDPLIYHVLSKYTKEKVYEEQMVESVVVSHLSRLTDVYFWKNKSEVDVIAIVNKKQVGFEVKWGFKSYRKPRHLKFLFKLDKENLATFLSSIDWLA